MPALLLAALLSATPAAAWVIDLTVDGRPIAPVDGHPAISVTLPSAVLARQEPLRFLGSRGTAIRGVGNVQCAVHLSDGSGTLSPAYDQCARVYEAPPGAWTDLLVQVAPSPARVLRLVTPVPLDGGGVALTPSGHLELPGVPSESRDASLYFGGRWWTASIEPGTGRLATEGDSARALEEWLAAPTDVLVVRAEQGDTTEVQWRLFPEDLPVALPEPELVALPMQAQEPIGRWCQPELGPGKSGPTFLYCLDATSGEVLTRRYLSNGTIAETDTRALPTGHFLEVAVRHDPASTVGIELIDGALHSTGEDLRSGEADPRGAAEDPVGAAHTTTRRRFAPRAPGAVSLRIEALRIEAVRIEDPGGDPTQAPAPIVQDELEVVRRDGAAIRLGLGLTLPASQEYVAVEDAAGAPEVGRDGRQVLEGEVLVGVAPFLEAGGRDRMAPVPFRLAPYVGLGVLAASGAELRFSLLQSFWAGMDMEITPGVSVVGAFTLRRVQRLVAGASVGDALSEDQEIPTGRVFRPGLGVAMTFTPEGLRLPARGR